VILHRDVKFVHVHLQCVRVHLQCVRVHLQCVRVAVGTSCVRTHEADLPQHLYVRPVTLEKYEFSKCADTVISSAQVARVQQVRGHSEFNRCTGSMSPAGASYHYGR